MPKHALALAAALSVAAPLAAAEPITGRWITDDKDAVVEIAPCGKQFCGTIARFLIPPPGGLDQRDTNNKDAAKRSRKLLGMMILTGFTPDEDAFRGRIYDPRNGKTYRSVLRRKSAGLLEVKGCMGPLCRTFQWVRAR
jgi:uncharacterized protein (DUF2147 family)